MAKYILPPLKEISGLEESNIQAGDSIENDPWYRRVRILADKGIIDQLKIGEMAEVKLKGKVISLEIRESEKTAARHEFELELVSVEAVSENEFSELADDEDD